MKSIRIIIKVLLCISLIIAVGLVLNYIRNLNPTADGFDVTNIIARLIHGDDYWTWEKLRTVYILHLPFLWCCSVPTKSLTLSI